MTMAAKSSKYLILCTAIAFITCFMSSCVGYRIVITTDWSSALSSEELSSLTEYFARQPRAGNTTLFTFTVFPNTTRDHLLASATAWKQEDNTSTILDMTSDCRVTDLSVVTGLALVRCSLISCPDVTGAVMSVRPGMETYVRAAFSYLRRFGNCLSRVVLLLQYQADLTDYPSCYKGSAIPLLSRVITGLPFGEEQTTQITAWLKGVGARSSSHYIVAVGSSSFLQDIIELGWMQLLASAFFHWVIVVTDTPAFQCSGCHFQTPLFHHPRLVDDLDLPQNLLVSYPQWVEASFTWKAMEAAINVGKAGARSTPVTAELSLDVQMLMENNMLQTLGWWRQSSGLVVEESMRSRIDDPSVLRIATLESPPFVFKITDENGTHYEGYAIDVIKRVASRLDLRYRFQDVSDGQFGYLLANGSWTGIMGDILSGAVDLAVAPLTVTAEREAILDFTTPFYEFAGIEILMKEQVREHDLLFFVTVFSQSVWGTLLGVLLLTGLLLAAFDYLSPYSERNARARVRAGDGPSAGVDLKDFPDTLQTTKHDHREIFNLKESLWLVTASISMSGPETTPRTLSSRTLVAGFWFFCNVIMASYTANLAAFLTTSRLSIPIHSLRDLAGQSKVKYSVVRGTSTQSYFQRMARIETNFYELWKNITSSSAAVGQNGQELSGAAVWDYPLDDTYNKIWSDIQTYQFLNSSQDGLKKVLAGDFALIDEAPYLQYIIAQHCGLTTVGKQFSTKSYAFALPQGSPLTAQVSNQILKLQSETVLDKLKQQWWQQARGDCAQPEESQGLAFYTLSGVFLLAGVGMAAGLLMCLLEIAWLKLAARRLKRRQHKMDAFTSRSDLVEHQFNSLDVHLSPITAGSVNSQTSVF